MRKRVQKYTEEEKKCSGGVEGKSEFDGVSGAKFTKGCSPHAPTNFLTLVFLFTLLFQPPPPQI